MSVNNKNNDDGVMMLSSDSETPRCNNELEGHGRDAEQNYASSRYLKSTGSSGGNARFQYCSGDSKSSRSPPSSIQSTTVHQDCGMELLNDTNLRSVLMNRMTFELFVGINNNRVENMSDVDNDGKKSSVRNTMNSYTGYDDYRDQQSSLKSEINMKFLEAIIPQERQP
jgi:hypothetical protein